MNNLEPVSGIVRAKEDVDSCLPDTRLSDQSLISIILCTRNRAEKLAHTLASLCSLNVPKGWELEIIVVDNGSTDATREVCEKSQCLSRWRLKYVFLATPGLGRARNFGIRAASGSILAFTDDDILPKENWLEVIEHEFGADSSLSLISGRVELHNPQDLPICIRQHKARKQFQEIGDAFSTFMGCNFAVRRSVFDSIGMFDPEFGPGARFLCADDAEFFYRLWKGGGKLVYVPEMLVFHDHGRRTLQAKVKLARWYVFSRGAFYAKYACQRDSLAVRSMYWEMRSALRDVFNRNEELGWRHPAWILEGFFHYTYFRLVQAKRNDS